MASAMQVVLSPPQPHSEEWQKQEQEEEEYEEQPHNNPFLSPQQPEEQEQQQEQKQQQEEEEERVNKNNTPARSGKTLVGDKYIIDDDAVVGCGAWSVVKRCTAVPPYEPPGARPGMSFVVKIIEKEYLISLTKGNVERAMAEVKREVDTLRHIPAHENVATFLEYIETEKHFLLFFEEVSCGDLCELILKRPSGRLSEEKAKKYIYQLIKAVLHCHLHDVVHRDIKPENLLVNDHDVIKLTDFGLAKRLKGVCTNDHALDPLDLDALAMPLETCERLLHKHITCFDVIGTPRYGAPEMFYAKFTHTTYDGFKADTWSIGVVTYITLTGTFPFSASLSASEEQIFHSIMDSELVNPSHATEDAIDFLKCVLCKDPARRIPLYATLCHPWLCDVVETRGSIVAAQIRNKLGETRHNNELPQSNLPLATLQETEDMISRFDEEAKLLHKCIARLQYEVIHLRSVIHDERERRNDNKSQSQRNSKQEESIPNETGHHTYYNGSTERANSDDDHHNDDNMNNNNNTTNNTNMNNNGQKLNVLSGSKVNPARLRGNKPTIDSSDSTPQRRISRARTPLYNSSLYYNNNINNNNNNNNTNNNSNNSTTTTNNNNTNGNVRGRNAPSPASRLRIISPARGTSPSSSSSSMLLYGHHNKSFTMHNRSSGKDATVTTAAASASSSLSASGILLSSYKNSSSVNSSNSSANVNNVRNGSRDGNYNSITNRSYSKPTRRSVSTGASNLRSMSHARGQTRFDHKILSNSSNASYAQDNHTNTNNNNNNNNHLSHRNSNNSAISSTVGNRNNRTTSVAASHLSMNGTGTGGNARNRSASRALSLGRSTPRRTSVGASLRTKSPLTRSAGGAAVRRGTPFRVSTITPIRSTTPARMMNNSGRSTSLVRRILPSSLYNDMNSPAHNNNNNNNDDNNNNKNSSSSNRVYVNRNPIINGNERTNNNNNNKASIAINERQVQESNSSSSNIVNDNSTTNTNTNTIECRSDVKNNIADNINSSNNNNNSVCNSSASMNSIHKLLDTCGDDAININSSNNNINNNNSSNSNYDMNNVNVVHHDSNTHYYGNNGRGVTPTRSSNTTFRSRTPQPMTTHHVADSAVNHNARVANTSSVNLSKQLQLNDEVIYKGCRGVIRYNGPTSFGAGVWIGLEMLEGNEGTNDGSSFIDKKQYFQCPKGRGVFVRASQVKKV